MTERRLVLLIQAWSTEPRLAAALRAYLLRLSRGGIAARF